MNIDIVTALNSDYMTINPKDKDHFVLAIGNGLPHVEQIHNRNENLYSELRLLANLTEEHPDFILKSVPIYENGTKTYSENVSLGELLNPSQVAELLKAYQEYDAISKQFQKDEIAFFQDKLSSIDRIDALFEGKRELNELYVAVKYQLIRQHSNNPFNYQKDALPCRIYLDGKILKIAQEDASANHGHSDYLFDEFGITNINLISPNGKDSVFPVKTVTLKHLATKEGNGEYDFADTFYKN